MQLDYMGSGSGAEMDTIRVNSTNRHVSHEWSAYAEDEIYFSDKWSLDAGFHLG